MLEKFAATNLRLPRPHEGVNINFCKNPLCSNFGLDAEIENQRGRSRSNDNQRSLYRVSGRGQGVSGLVCTVCTVSSAIKSNRAVHEEFERNLEALATPGGLHCPARSCANHFRSVESHPESYYTHGYTPSGGLRYRCKGCGKTFSDRQGHKRQSTSHENKLVFQLLVSKVAISKIAQITGLAPKTVYDKIDFLHGQCLKFTAERERRLRGMDLGDLKLCTDAQDYMVNWPAKRLRKTIQFRALATSCLDTGYVFACHPQVDPRIDTHDLEQRIEECGDLERKPAFREYARLWSREDYGSALELGSDYFAPAREDQDSPEHVTDNRQLPKQGSLVHIDYLQYGHFKYLHFLLGRGSGHVHFSIDADPGLGSACLASWKDKYLMQQLDVAIMTCDKRATVDQKIAAVQRAYKLRSDAMDEYPHLSEHGAKMAYFAVNSELVYLRGRKRGQFLAERGIAYPFVKKSEPGKVVRLLTDDGSRPTSAIVDLIHDTSLHQVDRFFMQVRRSIAGLERAPQYPRRAQRKWYLYGFYSPEMVEKTLTIYRTYFNFIAKGKDGRTPAMRLGLAKGSVRFEEVVYCS